MNRVSKKIGDVALIELKPKLHTKRLQWTHSAGSLQRQSKTVVISVQECYHQQLTSFLLLFLNGKP